MKKNNYILIFMMFVLSSCGNQSAVKRVEHDLNAKKAQYQSQKSKPVAYVSKMQKITFTSSERNPFNLATETTDKKKVLDPLNMVSINALRFVGTIAQGNIILGIIITPDNLSYKVKLGDSLGDHFGKIIEINRQEIKIQESYAEGASQISQRIVTLRLKEGSS